MNLLAVQFSLPFVGHIVRVIDDFRHEQFRIENAIIFWDHPSGNGQDSTEYSDVEEDGPMRCDLEVEEQVGVKHGGEDEDGCKRSSDKCHESATLDKATE